jgi:hypothetical protein
MGVTSSCFSNPADLQSVQCGYLNCFSYPGDVPPGTRIRNAAQSAQSGWLSCFSYPADVPPGPRRMHTGSACFKYPADVPPGPRRMHTGSTCFRY